MKPLRQFDLNLLLLLEALLTECHVSHAAERMFLSQSAMSHALNRLRQQLDDPLLVRAGNGLKRTPRAEAMLPDIRQAIRMIEHSLSPPHPFDPARSERCFTIASTDYFEAITLPPLIQTLRHTAPGIRIQIEVIREDSNLKQLQSGKVDLIAGLDAKQSVDKKLISTHWRTEPLACLVAEGDSAVADQLQLKEYCQLNHVLFYDLAGVTTDPIDQWLTEQQLQRSFIARTVNYMAGARIVAATDAIMTLPREMALLFAEMLPVRLVSPPQEMPKIEMVTLHHPLYSNDPGLKWLLQQLH